MPRTVITPQSLDTKNGELLTTIAADAANGMQFPSTNREVLVVEAAAASGVTVAIPSRQCSHGRLADVTGQVVAALATKIFGPFDPALYGDGAGNVLVDLSALTGTVTVAAVLIPNAS